jgi:prepilin-type N-terminal cleavage/methylation domain-containing protein
MKIFRKSQIRHAGFTLIELLVAVSIFLVVVSVGLGSLLTSYRAYQRAMVEARAVDNISFALENITRRLSFADDVVISNNNNVITFGDTLKRDSVGDPADIEIEYSSSDQAIFITDSSFSTGSGAQGRTRLTTENVEITNVVFEQETIGNRVLVRIAITAQARYGDRLTGEFSVYTSTVSRIPQNIP